MIVPPLVQNFEHRLKTRTFFRDPISHLRGGHSRRNFPLDEAFGDQSFQLTRKYFLRNPRHTPLQVRVSAIVVEKFPKHQHRPFPTDDVDRGAHCFTAVILLSCHFLPRGWLLTYKCRLLKQLCIKQTS